MRRIRSGWSGWPLLLPGIIFLMSGCHLFAVPPRLAVEPSGTRLYVVGGENSPPLRVVDTVGQRTIASIALDMAPSGIVINPTNGQLYVAAEKSVFIIDPSSYRAMTELAIGAEIESMAVNSTGTRVLVLHGHPDGVAVVDTAARRVLRTVDLDSSESVVRAIAAVPGADQFYLSQYVDQSADADESTISLLDTETLSVVAATSLDRQFIPVALAVDPSGHRLYAVGIGVSGPESFIGRLLVLETSTHRIIASREAGAGAGAVAVNPTGTRIYVLDEEGKTLIVFGPSGNTVLATVRVEKKPFAIAINSSGTEVYVAHSDGTISVVDALSNTIKASIRP